MGFLIKNITNFLNVNNKNYNIDLKINKFTIKPGQELYFDINEINFTIKKLQKLKYITYKIVDNYIKQEDYNEVYKNNPILPDITVIIPTFNNVNYIDNCIESIKGSKISNYNIKIILGIDNCEITKNHIINNDLYNDINIYYFNNNVGPYILKNTLIKYSDTDNIIFFDSDDIMEGYMVHYINYYLFKGFRFINFKYVDFGNTIKHNTSNYAEGVIGIDKNLFIESNGYYPWKCAADTEFRERYENKYGRTFRIDNVLFKRRIHTTNLTKRVDTGINSNIRNEYKKMMRDFRDKNYPDPDRLYIEEDYIKL
jgi:glycosyltransferase involved in cell wall biosynthesis